MAGHPLAEWIEPFLRPCGRKVRVPTSSHRKACRCRSSFGGGPRICIGNAFSMMETTLLLATIARQFRPRVVHPEKVILQPTMTLRPAHGIEVRLEARR